jgi:uncharacterized protein (TIGR03435 family)
MVASTSVRQCRLTRRSSVIVVVTICSLLGVGSQVLRARSQSASAEAAALPSFEVASVKMNKGGLRTSSLMAPGGRYSGENMTLRRLVREAYQVQDFQIAGGPSWFDSDHFDISAKAEGNPGREQVQLMLRRLLIERFRLLVRTDTKELPLYSLVKARKHSLLGPRLRASAVDCSKRPSGVVPRSPPVPDTGCGLGGGPGQLSGRGVTMDLLATTLAVPTGRCVRNRTGLAGTYDLDLEYTPDLVPQLPLEAPSSERRSDSNPSIFTAIQEQLGLKLQSERGPVTVLVVVRAERPTQE